MPTWRYLSRPEQEREARLYQESNKTDIERRISQEGTPVSSQEPIDFRVLFTESALGLS